MKLYFTRTLLASFFLTLAACGKKGDNLEVLSIKDLAPAEVENVLGIPDTAYTQTIVTKKIFTQLYKREYTLEIMYPEGLATDIVVHNPRYPFDKETIRYFGLDLLAPSHTMENAFIKWKNYPGFKTINMFATRLDSTGKVKEYAIFFKSDTGR